MAFFIGLITTRIEEKEQAEQRLQHFSNMLAEHTVRSLDGIDILLREISRDLSENHPDWHGWNDNRGWEYIADHSRALPQMRDIVIFDESGRQRFLSGAFPAPAINVSDRPYFQSLARGVEATSYGPFVESGTGRYVYGLARRIRDRDNAFAGVVFGSLELSYGQEFCWPIRLHDDFEAFLVNAEGKIITSCRPVDLSAQSAAIGRHVAEVLGRPGLSLETGRSTQDGLLLSVLALPSHADLKIVAALPEAAALAEWKRRLVEFGLFVGVIVAILLSGGWLLRRQVKELAEVSVALSANRLDLEKRVHQATEELERQKEEAERSSTAKSRFLAAASHDLRQPLHALSLFAADLQRQISSGYTRDLDQLAIQINSSVISLAEMLDTLLDISRLDMGGIEPDVQPFPVQAVFDRLHLSFRRAAMYKRITLRIRPSSLAINSDIHLVERLLSNLVSNAIRYTPEGGRVLVAARRRKGKVRVEVRDNGLGIAPENQEMIFKEFFQVGNAARDQKKGLGLGLSIVQRLSRALDAWLDLRSRPGAGTVFSVDLPLTTEAPVLKDEAAALLTLIFVGPDAELGKVAEMAAGWGYKCRFGDDLEDLLREAAKDKAIIFAAASVAEEIQRSLQRPLPVVTVGELAPESGVHCIRPPVRPAKVRALLQQIQNTLLKSM
ncbi:MAG: ATP-binding protein [Betaproteobacteria bacterium]